MVMVMLDDAIDGDSDVDMMQLMRTTTTQWRKEGEKIQRRWREGGEERDVVEKRREKGKGRERGRDRGRRGNGRV